MSRKTFKKIFGKTFKWGLLGLYVLVAAEVFLRIFSPVPILPRYVCATPYGIRGNIGNKKYTHTTPEYTVQIRTNSRGIRSDKEIPYEKPENTKRIVVLGDSFAMGYGVNLEDTFTVGTVNRLDKITGQKFELVNLASSGHGNAEELIVLNNEGLKYNPDIVLLCWHNSDYNDNFRSNLYKLSGDKLVATGKTYLPGIKTREKLFRIPGFEFIATRSQLYNKVRDYAGMKIKQLMVKFKTPSKKTRSESKPEEQVKPKINVQKQLTIALLKEIRDVCAKNNVLLVIFDIPYRTNRITFNSKFPLTRQQISEAGFNVWSPVDTLTEHADKNVKIYWERSHGHFTPRGCELVSEGLSEYIAKIYGNK